MVKPDADMQIRIFIKNQGQGYQNDKDAFINKKIL